MRHIAALARLGVTNERIPALVRELNGILTHMDALQSVDVSAANAESNDNSGMPLRSDAANSVVLQRAREVLSPYMRDGFFLVPRLETHGAYGAAEDQS